MSARAIVSALAAAFASFACSLSALDDEAAARLVRAYNDRVIEGFRTADPTLVQRIAGAAEAKKLTALIGVKLDQGITLDAQLLDFEVLEVERRDDAVLVRTRERWSYVDRRIGTGEVVGSPSEDRYRMRYRIERQEGRWVVARIEFSEPPVVGRTAVPDHASVPRLHGVGAP